MCGIFGYKGSEPAAPILEHGLQRLEYRGYDSAGIVVLDQNNAPQDRKAVGKVSFLGQKIAAHMPQGTTGIAHTRRATHGKPTEANTHPHHSADKHFRVVHNGIIENHVKLKKELKKQGYEFYSETDSEIVPALLQAHWTGDLLETIEKVLPMLHGAYALLILSTHCPDEMIGVKRGSPMIFGQDRQGASFFASDMQALSGYAEQVHQLQDGELIHIQGSQYQLLAEGQRIKQKLQDLDTEATVASKGDYETFMRKEIYEQPAIIARAFKGRINFANGDLYSNSVEFLKDKTFGQIIFVACGTSYHAGALGAARVEQLTGIPARAEIASEYMHRPIPTQNTLHVFLSQSGETADSIEVLKHIRNKGGITMGIVNTVGSSIANMTDCGYFLRAGTEIGVASTKAFTAQLACLMLFVLYLAKKHKLTLGQFNELVHEFEQIPSLMEQVLAQEAHIKTIAKDFAQYQHMFFLGRQIQFPIAQEGSLKLKEISYIHSEAYPAGELKHGPLALIDEACPTVLLTPKDELYYENMSSLAEIQSRNGKILVISDTEVADADRQITLPKTHPSLAPFLTTLAVQLLAYHVAAELGRDIDKPRNLAKSVTVK